MTRDDVTRENRDDRTPHTPGVFVRAHSKGLAGALSVRADSKRLIGAHVAENRGDFVRAESTRLNASAS